MGSLTYLNGLILFLDLGIWHYSLLFDYKIDNNVKIMFKGVFVYRDQGRNICFLLAPKVLLDYLRPMITNPIPIQSTYSCEDDLSI